jgi:predicted DNA-binding transcriptional regulator YafY
MTTSPPPPGFETSRAATPADLKSLPSTGQQAVQALEGCIKSHHVAEIDYTDAEARHSTIRLRAAYIRRNSAQHVVVWGMPEDADHWEELRLDRIRSVRDTGEVFEPTW